MKVHDSTKLSFRGIVPVMKGLRVRLLVALLLAIGLWAGLSVRAARAAAAKVTIFSHLLRGDEVEVRYDHSGCFYSASYVLKFQRGSELTMHVAELDVRAVARGVTNFIDLGTLALSEADAAGMDLLWQHYRTASRGNCSTDTENLLCVQRREGRITRAERFVDRFCTEREPGMIFLEKLIDRLQTAKR